MTDALQLRRYHGQLEAHEAGARLRIYDWLIAESTVREACEPFAAAMALGCISWPTVYAEALDVAVHTRIDHALPMVRLA